MKQTKLQTYRKLEDTIADKDRKLFAGPSYAEKVNCIKQNYTAISEQYKQQGSKQFIQQTNSTLAAQIGRNNNAVKEYLLHGEWLNADTITVLINNTMSRDFFIQAQRPKRRLVNDMKSFKMSDQKMENIVSIAMVDFFNEYQKEGRVINHKDLLPVYFDEEAGQLRSERILRKITQPKPQKLKYTPAQLFDVKANTISESEVQRELQSIINTFQKELLKRKKYGTKVMIKSLQLLIKKLLKQLYKIKRLQKINSKKIQKRRNTRE